MIARCTKNLNVFNSFSRCKETNSQSLKKSFLDVLSTAGRVLGNKISLCVYLFICNWIRRSWLARMLIVRMFDAMTRGILNYGRTKNVESENSEEYEMLRTKWRWRCKCEGEGDSDLYFHTLSFFVFITFVMCFNFGFDITVFRYFHFRHFSFSQSWENHDA